MVAPLVSAALVGAGASFLGGIFDRSANRKSQAEAYARDDTKYQRAVKDAKAAGLHPLFALGAGGAGSPSFMAGQSETGSALGDAVRGVGSVGRAHFKSKIPQNPLVQRLAELQIANAEINLASNRLDLTEKQRVLSGNAQVTQAAAGSQDIQLPPATGTQADVVEHAGKVEVVPSKTITPSKTDRGTAAGIHTLFQKYAYSNAPGGYLWLPRSDEGPAESLQGLSPALWAVIFAKNTMEAGKYAYSLIPSALKPSLEKIQKQLQRLRFDKAYGRIKQDELFKARVDSTKSTRTRLP